MTVLGGKTVLLTGALGSLGRAQAMTLGKAGARMLLLDRPGMANGQTIANQVVREAGTEAIYVGQDLGDLAASKARAI